MSDTTKKKCDFGGIETQFISSYDDFDYDPYDSYAFYFYECKLLESVKALLGDKVKESDNVTMIISMGKSYVEFLIKYDESDERSNYGLKQVGIFKLKSTLEPID